MKKILIVIFVILSNIVYSVAQVKLPVFTDLGMPVLDTAELKNIVRHHREFDNYDYLNDMAVCGVLYIYPDSTGTKILKRVGKKEYLIYFAKMNKYYAFNPDTDDVYELFYEILDIFNLIDHRLHFNIKYPNESFTYWIKLFNNTEDDRYLQLFFEYLQNTYQGYTNTFWSARTFEDMLNYLFGSPKNYIDTYNKRMEMRGIEINSIE